jgi:hypothetical protein
MTFEQPMSYNMDDCRDAREWVTTWVDDHDIRGNFATKVSRCHLIDLWRIDLERLPIHGSHSKAGYHALKDESTLMLLNI